jgi:hypothetical protein
MRRKIMNGRRRRLSLQPKKDEGRNPKMKAKVEKLHSSLLLRAGFRTTNQEPSSCS